MRNIFKRNKMNITHDKIKLIPFADVDKDKMTNIYLKWLNDLEVVSSIGSVELLEPKKENFVDESFKRFTSENTLGFFIQYDKEFIGTAKIDKINLHNSSAEIGIMIGEKSYWGKGIATEVYQLLIDYSFNELKINRLWGGCTALNTGMKKVFIKTGFIQEACLRESVNLSHPADKKNIYTDSLLFSMLRSDYKNQKK